MPEQMFVFLEVIRPSERSGGVKHFVLSVDIVFLCDPVFVPFETVGVTEMVLPFEMDTCYEFK
jgi:hypothetical protein